MGTSVEFFFRPPAPRLIRRITCGRGRLPAGRHPLDGEPGSLRRSRSLLQALHRHARQRRRAHQLRHRRPCLLPRGRRRHESNVRPARRRVSAAAIASRSRRFSTAPSRCAAAERDFREARAATIQAAHDLYGAGSSATRRSPRRGPPSASTSGVRSPQWMSRVVSRPVPTPLPCLPDCATSVPL